MKSSPNQKHSEKSAFQTQPPDFGIIISNNISVPQVKVNMRGTEHDANFKNFQHSLIRAKALILVKIIKNQLRAKPGVLSKRT